MRSGASVRADRCSAVREKKQLISTHVIMFFYMYCVRCWNVLIYKAGKHMEMMYLLCVFLLSNADGSCHDYSCQ